VLGGIALVVRLVHPRVPARGREDVRFSNIPSFISS